MEAGFRITNPNVVAACGCGSSFQARDEQPGAEPVAAAHGHDHDHGDGCDCAA